jgi:GTP-binding protein
MNKNFLVAIAGRPNVGKSCLFNRLIGKRQAIVEPSSGVTRDRVYAQVDWNNKEFRLVDTGGLNFDDKTFLSEQIIRQAYKGIKEADLILFLLASVSGITADDWEILSFLRKADCRIIMVINKVDNMAKIPHLGEFYELGIEPMIFVSALHGLNIDELLDTIADKIKPVKKSILKQEPMLKIALIGKPNVGKSSFLNRLIREERVIVSDLPGTTRDSVDTQVEIDGHSYLMIDTAGIKRKKMPDQAIDVFSRSRTISAVKRSDICIVLVDAVQGIKRDDLHIFNLVKEEQKCCVIAINKSDLVNITIKDCRHTLSQKAAYMNFAFSVLCSAKKGKNVHAAVGLAHEAWTNSQKKIKQRHLAETLNQINQHMINAGKRPQLKIHYLTQIKIGPPAFVLIVNRPELIKPAFIRFIESRIRKNYNFQGTPINIIIKKKKKGTPQ